MKTFITSPGGRKSHRQCGQFMHCYCTYTQYDDEITQQRGSMHPQTGRPAAGIGVELGPHSRRDLPRTRATPLDGMNDRKSRRVRSAQLARGHLALEDALCPHAIKFIFHG